MPTPGERAAATQERGRQERVTPKTWLLLAWVVVGMFGLIAHAGVLARALRSREPYRWVALFPPAAPIVAWRAGARLWPLLWLLLVVVYVTLRFLEGAV